MCSIAHACWSYFSEMSDAEIGMKDFHIHLLDRGHSPKCLALVHEDIGIMLQWKEDTKVKESRAYDKDSKNVTNFNKLVKSASLHQTCRPQETSRKSL